MRYASAAAAAERRSVALAKNMEKTMRNRRDKCINSLEPEHLNRRVLIGKRPSQRVLTSKVDRAAAAERCQTITEGAHQAATPQSLRKRAEESPRRPSHLRSRDFLWHSCATHQ